MIVEFNDLKKLAEPFSEKCPVCGSVCDEKIEAGFFPSIYLHGDTMCSQYPPAAEHRAQRTAGTWRKFLNFVGRVADSLRRR